MTQHFGKPAKKISLNRCTESVGMHSLCNSSKRTLLNRSPFVKPILIFAFCCLFYTGAFGQPIRFGANQYIEYQVGTLPFIISVPHGGDLEPASIPNRTCNNPVFDTDAFTVETALEIKQALYSLTGCYPHLILNHLKRSKLDCNRNISDGACGNGEAETAWHEFNDFIDSAQNTANLQYSNQTFYVDLHGHGNPIQRIELGYLLYDDELAFSDNTLNTAAYINFSSIKNLVSANVNHYTHAQLLRGPFSLGSLLASRNYPSVPSLDIPYPGTSTNYFSGGYLTAHHTSYAAGVVTKGLQMELNYAGIRNSAANRTQFSEKLAEALVQYMNTHFNMVWNGCLPLTAQTPLEEAITKTGLVPNPVRSGQAVVATHKTGEGLHYQIFNATGTAVLTGFLEARQSEIKLPNLSQGLYWVKIQPAKSKSVEILKLLVE